MAKKQTLKGAANLLVPTKPLSKTRAMSRATPQGQAGYSAPQEPVSDRSTFKVLDVNDQVTARIIKIDAQSASEEGLTIHNTGAGNPRITFETAATYIQDEGTQFTFRGDVMVHQLGTRAIFETGGGKQELNISAAAVTVNAGTSIANFRVDTTSGRALYCEFGTDNLYLDATNIGFHGATPQPRHPPIIDAAGGAVVDIEARQAVNMLLSMLRTRGDIVP